MFFSKEFNEKQNNAEAWLKLEDYDYDATFDLEKFRNCLCVAGTDLAESTDLCSAFVLFIDPEEPNKRFVYSKYFIPEGKLKKGLDDKSAGAKYEEWARKGLLQICDGNYINTSYIADWFFSLYNDYGFRCFKDGYDAKFSNEFINRMDLYGFETETVWQRPETMTPSINMVESDLKDQSIIGLNEIDKWCLGNAPVKMDNRGYVM